MPICRDLTNSLRARSLDAVQKTTLGYPGAPPGMADSATVPFLQVLKFNHGVATWIDRDRFVFSNGDISMQPACRGRLVRASGRHLGVQGEIAGVNPSGFLHPAKVPCSAAFQRRIGQVRRSKSTWLEPELTIELQGG